jgi:hypothetical protein
VGRLNLSHAAYWVTGHDEAHGLAQRVDSRQGVSAFLGAIELSMDRDWLRPKLTAFFASGDSDPEDGKARGFDAIYDGVNVAGGAFSFWARTGIPLPGTGVLLKAPFSLLPDLRSNKFEGQANHVNPGILLVGAGLEADLTPKLRLMANANALRFHHTEVLETLLHQPDIRPSIGLDLGAGVVWRPLLSENVVVTAGVTGLLPGAGMRDLFSSACDVPGCGKDEQTLANAFVQLRLTY